MPVYGMVNRDIDLAIWRRCGDLVRDFTATGGSTTTIVSTALIDATDNAIKGCHVYCNDGTGQSQETRATAFTPASDTITVPTQGTAFASGSRIALTQRFSHSDLLDVKRGVLHAQGPYAKRYLDQSLIAGSPLVNATFYDGSGTFPNGWTVSGGTWTQESAISKHGRYSAKGVSSGAAAASIYQEVANIGLYRGKSVVLHGWIFTNIASRVNWTLDDGIDTTTGVVTVTDANAGWGSAELTTPALTVSNRASRLRITANITDGSAVTAYFSAPWITGYDWREWNVPAGSPSSIHRIHVEDFVGGPFGLLLARDAYDVVEESTKRLRVNTCLPQGRILEIQGRTGWTDLTAPTTDDDATFDGPAEGMIAAAAAMLLESKTDGSDSDARRIQNLRVEAARHSFPAFAVKAPAGSLIIERA